MQRRIVVVKAVALLVLALAACAASGAAAGADAAGPGPGPGPIVTVLRHGGLCVTGRECRSVLRITDTTVSGRDFEPRRLQPGERRALLRAIRALDRAYLAAHPFRGTCPTAYDGQESVYRFRGFARPLASCRYDLRGVAAVQVVERLLAALEPS